MTHKKAGFWVRLAANAIDSIAMSIVLTPLSFLILMPVILKMENATPDDVPMLVLLVFGITLIETILLMSGIAAFISSKWQGTPGKLLVGIRISRPNGERITFWRALGRLFAQYLSGIFFIGYLMIAFRKDKRGLHDLICDTVVTYKSNNETLLEEVSA